MIYLDNILLTHAPNRSLFELLSQRVQRACRRVDRIVVKGASEPMTIYTFDYGAVVMFKSLPTCGGGTHWMCSHGFAFSFCHWCLTGRPG